MGIGTSLVVQQLRLHAPNAGDLTSIPGQGPRAHMPQLRPSAAKEINKMGIIVLLRWPVHSQSPKT